MTAAFPALRLFTPAELCVARSAQQQLAYDNPFGFTWRQALRSDAVFECARQMALDCGVDARAQLVVETLLRWKLSETATQQHVMLEHRDLTNAAGDDRAAIGDGLLLIACCQVIPSNEAYATYRELFTDQPVAAATGLVAPPPAIGGQQKTSSAAAIQEQFAARYGKAGEQFYEEYSRTYPVTTAALGASATAAAEPASLLNLSDDEAEPQSDDDADMVVDAAPQPPPPPPAMHDARLLAWHDALLRTKKCRIRIVLRGYISRAVVRSAARLNTASGCMYVLDSRCVCPDATSALAAEPVACDSTETSTDSVLSAQRESVDDDNDALDDAPSTHLLDRLDSLALDRLTHYELNRAVKHRFNLHATLYSFWHADCELDTSLVRLYPRGFDAPVLQRFRAAPGLLTTATHQDYAAIGLAGLCVLATMSAPFRQWLLDAEAYYYRAAVENGEPTAYLSRIDGFISHCVPPPPGALHVLLTEVLDAINRKIKEVDSVAACLPARPADDEDDAPINVEPPDETDGAPDD